MESVSSELPALDVSGLVCAYGLTRVLHEVTFALRPGTVLALVGPNGAGKTTLLRACAGLMPVQQGSISVSGHPVLADALGARTLTGTLLDTFGLYERMSVLEALRYAARSRGLRGSDVHRAVDFVVQWCALSDWSSSRIATLSRGWRQWVGVAQALVHRPRLLLLDEPASGLDPDARVLLGERLRALAAEASVAVVVSSHILAELDRYADGLAVMARGRLLGYHVDLDPSEGGLEALYAKAMGEGEQTVLSTASTPAPDLSGWRAS